MNKPLVETTLFPTEAAKKVSAIALEHRNQTENSRKVAPEIIEQIISFKLGRLALPKYLGGWEDDPIEVLKTYEELAKAEASVAWTVWNNHLACIFGKFLDKKSLDEIYSNSSHLYANSTRPEGFANEVEDGYIVSGRWTLVSGCELADWFALRCLITPKGEPQAVLGPGANLKILFLPKSVVRVIDTWDVGGLKGTGSHDVEIKEAFVPTKYAIEFTSPVWNDNAYNRLPIGCMNAAGCASMALGIVQSAANELRRMGLERVTPGKNPDLRDRPTVQLAIAKSTSMIAAMRKQLHDSVSKLWELAQENKTYSDNELADVWTASYLAATTARSLLTEIYSVAGTSALYTKGPIERAHRDIHALMQHGIIQPHWMNHAGMAYMGITPKAAMFRI